MSKRYSIFVGESPILSKIYNKDCLVVYYDNFFVIKDISIMDVIFCNITIRMATMNFIGLEEFNDKFNKNNLLLDYKEKYLKEEHIKFDVFKKVQESISNLCLEIDSVNFN